MRRAKIVCTLGPSAEAVDRLVELINAGMNVARLNMSHGDYTEHGTRLANVREAQHLTGKAVGVFADLQGPKIRLGRFEDNAKPHLDVGDIFTITVGCKQDATTCNSKFSNIANFRGFNLIPGPDMLLFYPKQGDDNLDGGSLFS